MNQVVIYKESSRSGLKIFAGVVVSKKKTYKIRALKSGHFANSYRAFVRPEHVIAIVEDSDKNIIKMMDKIKESKAKAKEYDDKIRNLEVEKRKAIQTISIEIEKMANNTTIKETADE